MQTEEDADFDRLARDSSRAEESFSAAHISLRPEHALAEQRAATDVEAALTAAVGELPAEDACRQALLFRWPQIARGGRGAGRALDRQRAVVGRVCMARLESASRRF